MKIDIEVIPHEHQRYPTAGDWQWDKMETTQEDRLQINVSETGDEDSNFLIALHEMIEAYLCKKAGVTEEQVDKWDKDHLESNDPGSLPNCPYYNQHLVATGTEMAICASMDIYWSDHEKRVNDLDNKMAL